MTFKIPSEGLPSFTDVNGVTTGQGRMEHRLFKRDQSWCYEAIWALCGHKLRAMVTRNAYDAQSFCKVQVFYENVLEWKFLCDLPFNQDLACYKVAWAQDAAEQLPFEIDADRVIEKACRILNPFYASVVGGAGEATAAPAEVVRLEVKHVTKVVLIARIHFSDGSMVDREVDK